MSDATSISSAPDRRWLILGVIGLAQLMVVLSLTVMNIALPSAQRALHFTTVDRQWVVTAYTLAFGSLLLLGGRLADLLGRKVTFLTGLVGFAGVSAIGGASVNFAMLITARACQGAFARAAGAVGAVAADHHVHRAEGPRQGVRRLRRDRRGRRRGRPAARRRADRVPVLALDAVREPDLRRAWRSRRSAAADAAAVPGQAQAGHPGRAAGLRRACSAWSTASPTRPRTAGTRRPPGGSWPPAWCCWRRSRSGRAGRPTRCCRPGWCSTATGAAPTCRCSSPRPGMFGIFLFLTYYLQQTLGYSPLVTGVAFLPISGGLIVAANLSTIVLMPRIGPKPLVAVRDAGRRGRDGLAGPAGPAHRLRRRRARPAHPGRDRPGPGDRAGRSTPAPSAWPRRTRASPRPPSPSASSSAPRSAPRC